MSNSSIKKYNSTHLLRELGINSEGGGKGGVFGICYSILNGSGMVKGVFDKKTQNETYRDYLKNRIAALVKVVPKVVESGHVTTFLYNKKTKKITFTGIGDGGWVFEEEDVKKKKWAKQTTRANTYVYYTNVDCDLIAKYEIIRKELEITSNCGLVTYAVVTPNIPVPATDFQNCISHSYHLMYKLGLAHWFKTKGWWVPSIGNWADYFCSFASTWRGAEWKYKMIQNTNTNI